MCGISCPPMRNGTIGVGWWIYWIVGQLLFPVLLFALVVIGYGIMAVALAAWPVGHAPTGTIMVGVSSNPFHADLILPADGWRDVLGLPDNAVYLVIGWGQRAFYLETPRFDDLSPHTALDALFGRGAATLHVAWLPGMALPGPSVARFTVTPEQLARLKAYVRTYLVLDQSGKATRIPGAYGTTDYFYAATGHWTPALTCNEWVGRALREADIRTGLWTPFSYGLLTHLAGTDAQGHPAIPEH